MKLQEQVRKKKGKKKENPCHACLLKDKAEREAGTCFLESDG
jgi:hypothetical protein